MLAGPESNLLLLEGTTGGSRLHIAQKYNMTIPCIVNDWTGRFDHAVEVVSEAQARAYYKDQPKSIQVDPRNGYFESFDDDRVAYHMGEEWAEDRIMPLRAPMWISILNRHGYKIDRIMPRVQAALDSAGVDQTETPVKK
jgi:hypothetical protein